MCLTVRVHPRASRPRIEWDGVIVNLWVRAAPVNGAANAAALAAIAQWLGAPRAALRLVSGQTRRLKVIDIGDLAPPDDTR